jgi:heat shock protein HslJ
VNRFRTSHGLALAGLLLAATIVACGPAATPTEPMTTAIPPAAGNPLAGSEWQLVSLYGEPLLEDTYISLRFEEDRLGGFAGCNHYGGGPDSGSYNVTPDGSLEAPLLAITQMLCVEPDGVMEQEDAFVKTLTGASAYHLEDDILSLQNAEGETVLVFERVEEQAMDPTDLIGTAWRLASLDEQPLLEASTLTLAFHDEHRAGGYAGCRAFVASYKAQGDELTIFSMAMMGAICDDDGLQQQEGEYTTVLGWANRFSLERDRLELRTSRGETLVYEALPAEAQPDLEGPTWSLLAFVEPGRTADPAAPTPLLSEPLPGTQITITFADGQVSGTAGCNQYGGSYSLNGAVLPISNLFQTEMACIDPVGVMEQEQNYLDTLRAAIAAHIYGSQLWVEVDGGSSLVFVAE